MVAIIKIKLINGPITPVIVTLQSPAKSDPVPGQRVVAKAEGVNVKREIAGVIAAINFFMSNITLKSFF